MSNTTKSLLEDGPTEGISPLLQCPQCDLNSLDVSLLALATISCLSFSHNGDTSHTHFSLKLLHCFQYHSSLQQKQSQTYYEISSSNYLIRHFEWCSKTRVLPSFGLLPHGCAVRRGIRKLPYLGALHAIWDHRC